tara:strand:- start:1935 stop:2399 length:465 start_codon:yes stop_codon:yes gene_type:complete
MSLKIKVDKNGKQYYADADKVFAWLMERFLKNQGRKSEAKLEPYKDRVENFFSSLKTTEADWYKMLKEAYPAIDVDFALNRAKLWLMSNYKKDFKKFLMNWMSKENPTIQIERKREAEPRRAKTYTPPEINEDELAEPQEIKAIFNDFLKGKKV